MPRKQITQQKRRTRHVEPTIEANSALPYSSRDSKPSIGCNPRQPSAFAHFANGKGSKKARYGEERTRAEEM